MVKPALQSLKVWGDFACFSQPTMGKVERFSYPIITPSAARGIFDAIHWKPAFRWQVERIEMLTFPRYIGLLRNEVQRRAPDADTIIRWIEGRSEPQALTAGAGSEIGTPRQTMALKDVCYRIHARAHQYTPSPDPAEQNKIESIFRRRAASGQCVHQPYFGCREFAANFALLSPEEALVPSAVPVTMPLGWMLYDVFNLSRPGAPSDAPFITAFEATITNGILDVPAFESAAVRKPSGPSEMSEVTHA